MREKQESHSRDSSLIFSSRNFRDVFFVSVSAMKYPLLIALIAAFSIGISAQSVAGNHRAPADSCPCEQILYFAEEMPTFSGDENGFQKYLSENIHYPDSARKAKQGGTVYIAFTVDQTGAVCEVKVLKGITGAPSLNEEAVRVMRASPNWRPGKMNGKPVCTNITVPIKFVPKR